MKIKLIIIFICFNFSVLAQIPNTEAFSLQNVVTELSGVGTQKQVDQVIRNSTPGGCNISCNGYSELMLWNTDITTTISNFITTHGNDFGAVTLYQTYSDRFTFTANVAGVGFTAATIPVTYGTAENLVPNISESSDLVSAYSRAVIGSFDSRYYSYYLVSGSQLLATNSLLNFRNYGDTPDGIPVPVTTGAVSIGRTNAFILWNSSVGATGFYYDVSIYPDFSSMYFGHDNIYVSYDTWNLNGHGIRVDVLYGDLTYYYRVRADTPNGESGNSNVSIFKTCTPWFLPSHVELGVVFQNLIPLDVGDFSVELYWPSSESGYPDSYSDALIPTETPPYYFSWSFYRKYNTYNVRAVRTFISSFSHNIGDPIYNDPEDQYVIYGYIFYKIDNGDGTYTYYECAATDLSSGYAWSNITNVEVGTGQGLGTGRANTIAIMGQSGHTSSAAKLCNDLTTD